jgi:cytochrome P450
MGDWLDTVVAERRGCDGDDLISVLLRAEEESGALTHDELRVFVFTLLVAGSITTAYLIGNTAAALFEHPELETRARHDPTQVAAIVEESLRHDAPTQLMFRTATEAVDVAGTTIPSRATVVALLGSANRDPVEFSDPDRFDADRGPTAHLTFGHGVHFCLGAALARLEATIAIQELLARSARLDAAGELERVSSLVFRGPSRLPARAS